MAIEEAARILSRTRPIRSVASHSGRREAAVRGEAAVGCEQVEMGVPLQEASRGGDRDDEAGAQVASGPTADELDGRFCARPGERGEEVSPAAKERPQQARDGQHHVAVSVISTPSRRSPRGPFFASDLVFA